MEYPLYNTTTAITADLSAGDAIFVPSGWFHYAEVVSSGGSVSVSGRAYTTCEVLSLWDVLLSGTLRHFHGGLLWPSWLWE